MPAVSAALAQNCIYERVTHLHVCHCTRIHRQPDLSVTAVGAKRGLLLGAEVRFIIACLCCALLALSAPHTRAAAADVLFSFAHNHHSLMAVCTHHLCVTAQGLLNRLALKVCVCALSTCIAQHDEMKQAWSQKHAKHLIHFKPACKHLMPCVFIYTNANREWAWAKRTWVSSV